MFQFEIKQVFRSPFVGLMTLLLLVFVLFATYNGRQRVEKYKATIGEVQQKQTIFYEKQRLLLDSIEKGQSKVPAQWFRNPSNPLVLSAFRGAGWYSVKVPAPLAVVSTGQSDIFPYYSKVVLGRSNAAGDNDNFENPFNTAIGEFDLAFVLVFILPLLVIAFSYNLLSAEREQGTLRLLLSMPLNIRFWLAYKIAFRLGLLFLLSTLLIGFSFLLLGIDFSHFSFLTLLFYLFLYIIFWFLVAFWVNLLEKSSASNAMLLLGIWLFFALIVPSVASMVASTLYPVPSRVEYVTAKRAAETEAEKQTEKIVSEFYAQNPQFKRPENEAAKGWKEYWREGFAIRAYEKKLLAEIETRFQAQAQSQRQFANYFQWFSPAILFQNALNRLAQTDTESYLAFLAQTEAFEQRWTAFFKDRFMKDEAMLVKDFNSFPKP